MIGPFKKNQSIRIHYWEDMNWDSAWVIIVQELSWSWKNSETKRIKSITMSRLSVQESNEWSLVLYLSVRLLRVQQRGIRYFVFNEI